MLQVGMLGGGGIGGFGAGDCDNMVGKVSGKGGTELEDSKAGCNDTCSLERKEEAEGNGALGETGNVVSTGSRRPAN